MTKPSQLTEGQWIKITAEHKSAKAKASIGFHVEYSQFCCFSLHPKCDADNGHGLTITEDKEFADALYAKYLGGEHITITTGGGYHDHEDKTTKIIQQGTPADD